MTAKPEPTPIRLISFRIPPEYLPSNCRNVGVVTVEQPDQRLIGWSLAVRGAAVFLLSPRGWEPGTDHGKPKHSLITTIGPIPMQHCALTWRVDDPAAIDKLQRFDVPPLSRAVTGSEGRTIDSKEMGDP